MAGDALVPCSTRSPAAMVPDTAKTFGPLPDQRTSKHMANSCFYWSSKSFTGPISLTLNVRGPSYMYLSWTIGQYHGCWCPGSLCRQDISTHDTDYVEQVGPCLTQERISTTCVMSVWRNDRNCKYIFMFLLKNLACKELTFDTLLRGSLREFF